MNEHQVIPPSKLVEYWRTHDWMKVEVRNVSFAEFIAIKAANWGYQQGADKELEACCEWFQEFYKTESWVDLDLKTFRATRRPKPPSLKEQAISDLNAAYNADQIDDTTFENIKHALESLND